MTPDFEAEFVTHRSVLLRHCYRMLGSSSEAEDLVQETLERAWRSRAQFAGNGSVKSWLYAIATNVCLSAIAKRRRVRLLPQLEQEPASGGEPLDKVESERWISPASDAQLFQSPPDALETMETVSLAFVALLQRVPARQRAALLMKDVLGWSASEIATTLELSTGSVNSALHRARKTITNTDARADEPSAETLRAFVNAWSTRDVDALVTLLREDVKLAMPPYAAWFAGRTAVRGFFSTPGFESFWSSVSAVKPTRANGLPALAFLCERDGHHERHSIMVVRFVGEEVAEMTVFMGSEYFAGFDDLFSRDRTVSDSSLVMKGKEITS